MAKSPREFPSAIRAKEIQRVLLHRYRLTVPDDDAGRDDLHLLLRHLAHLPCGSQRMVNYLDLYAPWLVGTERAEALQEAARSRPPYLKADTVAKRLNVTAAIRTALRLTTIGAIDLLKAERDARRRKLAATRQANRRRKLGRKPRAEYLNTSAARIKPWEAEGLSRATWYRHRQA